MCVLSALLINATETVHKVEGRELLGVCVGHESYDLWRVCFGPIFESINKHKDGNMIMTIDGVQYHIKIFLGGDYKFLSQVQGLNAATADYSCIWCYCHKVRIVLHCFLQYINPILCISPIHMTFLSVS